MYTVSVSDPCLLRVKLNIREFVSQHSMICADPFPSVAAN